ncbi:hypothetical protein F5Y19DRAFT_464135 [Xylariaceae sp. FL1651]|nr:hypothetical protein F5Y19DRAFT_464135 [Xylariaceae sp. FL1651]
MQTSTSNVTANLRGSEEGEPRASDPVSGADPNSISGVDPHIASRNNPGLATPAGPPQTSYKTRASLKSRWKRGKRPTARRNNTKAVEKLYQKQRQHQTPAWHLLYTTYPVVEERYPLALTLSKTSTWLAKEDHPFSIYITKVKWEALKKQPRNNNPLGERYDAAPFRIAYSHHLLAGLLQVVGVPASGSCRACKKDQGRWATCVISYDHSSIDIAKGAYANCLYTSAEAYCSFRESLPQDTADTDTNPELQDLEGKGFPTHLAANDAIKQAQQHNGYQIVKISSNLQPAKPMYQKFCCFRRDDLTSGGVKTDDPCFWTIRVDFVDGSWVVQRPDGTHSHDAVDYTTPKPNWRCDVCEQDFD